MGGGRKIQLAPAYCAGLFDGEGNVEITNKHSLRIRICNTYKPVIDQLLAQFGGCICINRPSKKTKPNHRVGYSWTACGERASTFLQLVKPFLIIKQQQALLALTLRTNRRGVKLPPAEKERRSALKAHLSQLNKRGTFWQDIP